MERRGVFSAPEVPRGVDCIGRSRVDVPRAGDLVELAWMLALLRGGAHHGGGGGGRGNNNYGNLSVFVGNLAYETSWQDLKDHTCVPLETSTRYEHRDAVALQI